MPNNVVISNGHNLQVKTVVHSQFFPKLVRDDNAYFGFHSKKCFIKYQAFKVVILEGFLDESGFISSPT